MTTGEHLVDISTLTTGTAMDHFLNISTGSGFNIYVSEILEGKVLELENLEGKLVEQEYLTGKLAEQESLIGKLHQTEILMGTITEIEIIKGV